MRRNKSKLIDDLLADGTVHYGFDSQNRLWEDGHLVEPAKIEPKRAADVVVRPPAKANLPPRLTDPPKPTVSAPTRELHGLELAIAANVAAAQGKTFTPAAPKRQLHGLALSIAANVEAEAKKKLKE